MIARSPNFWPFDYVREQGAIQAHDGDFDLVEAVEEIELTKTQCGLLKRMIERIKMVLWFHDDADDEQPKRGGPHIELVFFWGDSEMVISSVNLLNLFEAMIEDEYEQTGYETEIAALEKLKMLCERGIQNRNNQPAEDASSD